MKKFFAIYLSILCAFPILANGDVPCSTYNNNRASCLAKGGCWFDSFGSPTVCDACYNDQYNPQQQNCEDNDNCDNSCQPVPANNFKNSDGTWYLPCPINNKYTYTNTEATYIGNCTCPADTILINTTENSTNSYYCGQCGDGGMQSQSGDIYTCSCQANVGVNNVHGATDNSGTRVECACPTGANWNNNSCKCSANKYLHQDNNGVYSCESCPTHSTSAVGSTNVNDCQCDGDFPKRILDENNNLIGCSACADNASFQDSSCQCDSGYYGDGTSSCTQCPIGTTTTTIGATQRSDCEMNHNTKFCYGSDDNKKCMHLIPADTVISVSNNT